MPGSLFEKLRDTLRGVVTADEPLARHTTWRVGGPADLFVAPEDRADLLTALKLLAADGVPWLVLGAGSNLLVRDGGLRGAVVHTGRLRELDFGPGGTVRAGGGLPLMTLIREAARRGLGGLEAMAGIPGTLGGGVAMNAGAGGQDIGSVVRSVTLAGPTGEERWGRERLRFAYRRSNLPGDRVLVAAELQLHEVEAALLEEAIAARIRHRREAQGVGAPNAGSVFKNPSGDQAWRLIDAAGLRGLTVGGARVSERHANFIVNAGGATARDILELIDRVREAVRRQSGTELEPEVRIVGED